MTVTVRNNKPGVIAVTELRKRAKSPHSQKSLTEVNDWLTRGEIPELEHTRVLSLLALIRSAFNPTADDREVPLKRVNQSLRIYMACPQIEESGTEVFVRMMTTRRAFGPSMEETNVVWNLMELAQSGVLYGLQSCEICTRLFLSSREGQGTCGTACSRKRYARTDAHKKQRRDYMRRIRKEEKES